MRPGKLTSEEMKHRQENSQRLADEFRKSSDESLVIFEDAMTGRKQPTREPNPLLKYA